MLKPVATIELVLMDSRASIGAVVLNIPASSTVEIGDAQATALASLIAPMSDAVLVRYRICYRFQYDDIGVAESGAAVVNAGAFLLMCDPPAPPAVVIVPAIKDSLLLTDGPTAGYGIDRSNSDVVAFLEQLIAMNVSNTFGDAITAIEAAYRQSRT